MATVTVRGIPEGEKEALRVRAAKNGRSMEAELRSIIHEAVASDQGPDENLYAAIRRRVAPFGGVDLPEHPDEPVGDPPRFE